MAAWGRIDVLVNNVGGSAPGGPVEMSEEVWDAQVDFNLKSVFLACKHVLPVMEKQGGGAIVSVASASGLRWTGAAQVAYAATKAGVIQFSRVLAVQYAPKGIRVNTVIPGQLHTPMVEARLARQRAGGDVEALLRQRQARIPLGFMGDGRDTANAALFLASDEARFITGTEIVVDGGMVARCDWSAFTGFFTDSDQRGRRPASNPMPSNVVVADTQQQPFPAVAENVDVIAGRQDVVARADLVEAVAP